MGFSQTVPYSILVGGSSVDSVVVAGITTWRNEIPNPELFGDFAHTYNSGSTSTQPSGGSGDQQLVESGATYTAVLDTDGFGLGDYVVEVTATEAGSLKRVRLYMDLPDGVYDWRLTCKGADIRFFIYDGAANGTSIFETSNTVTEYTGSFTATGSNNQQFAVGFSSATIGEKLRFKISVKAQL